MYTNIGIVNTGIGTISNEDGTFSLQVPEQNSNDTLLFSAIGFRKRHFPIQSIMNAVTFYGEKMFKIHILGQTGEELKRPFKVEQNFMQNLLPTPLLIL